MIQSKFEGHIHARVLIDRPRLASAQIVNTIFGATNEFSDAIEPRRRVVGVFWSEAGVEAEIDDAKG